MAVGGTSVSGFSSSTYRGPSVAACASCPAPAKPTQPKIVARAKPHVGRAHDHVRRRELGAHHLDAAVRAGIIHHTHRIAQRGIGGEHGAQTVAQQLGRVEIENDNRQVQPGACHALFVWAMHPLCRTAALEFAAQNILHSGSLHCSIAPRRWSKLRAIFTCRRGTTRSVLSAFRRAIVVLLRDGTWTVSTVPCVPGAIMVAVVLARTVSRGPTPPAFTDSDL